MEGWKDGRMEGWTDGRMEGWKDGKMEGWRDGRVEGWKDGRMEGWKDGGELTHGDACRRARVEQASRPARQPGSQRREERSPHQWRPREELGHRDRHPGRAHGATHAGPWRA